MAIIGKHVVDLRDVNHVQRKRGKLVFHRFDGTEFEIRMKEQEADDAMDEIDALFSADGGREASQGRSGGQRITIAFTHEMNGERTHWSQATSQPDAEEVGQRFAQLLTSADGLDRLTTAVEALRHVAIYEMEILDYAGEGRHDRAVVSKLLSATEGFKAQSRETPQSGETTP